MSVKTSVKYIKDEKFEVYAHNSDVKIYIDSKSQEHNPEGPGPVDVATDAVFNDKREVFLKFIRNCPIHNTILNTKEVAIKLVQ